MSWASERSLLPICATNTKEVIYCLCTGRVGPGKFVGRAWVGWAVSVGRPMATPVATPVAGGPCQCAAKKNTFWLCKLKVQRQSGKYARWMPTKNTIGFRIASRTINLIPLFLNLQAAMSVHASAFPISTRKSHNGFHLSHAQKKQAKTWYLSYFRSKCKCSNNLDHQRAEALVRAFQTFRCPTFFQQLVYIGGQSRGRRTDPVAPGSCRSPHENETMFLQLVRQKFSFLLN